MRIERALAIAAGFIATATSGCAPGILSASDPPIQIAINPHFHAQFEPLRQGHDSFVAFRLTVTNETAEPLQIDWSQTRYLYNGVANGLFLFAGLAPEAAETQAVPLDTIPPQGILTKVIAPQKLVADPLVRDSIKSRRSVFTGGPVPPGRSGIFLVVKRNDANITETLTVDITRSDGESE